MNAEDAVDAVGARQLRILIALAEEGTLTDAAIRVGLSQPAVSRALARLDETLGTRLVVRTTRSLSLTSEGRACYESAIPALRALATVVDAARAARFPSPACGSSRSSRKAGVAIDEFVTLVQRCCGAG